MEKIVKIKWDKPENKEWFYDDNIEIGKEKYLVAINMGIIGKFLDSDYKKEFSKLINLIDNSNTLKENEVDRGESDSVYEYISFSEYSIYNIDENGISSDFIDKLFNKVFSKEKSNPFYSAYLKLPDNVKYNCPVVFNFESIIDNKALIIKTLLLLHLEHNIMLTPRILWNFIYEITMGNDVELNYMYQSDLIFESKFYITNLWFNRMFDNQNEDEIIKLVTKHVNIFEGNERIDEMLQNFHIMSGNEKDLNSLFDNYYFSRKNKFIPSIIDVLTKYNSCKNEPLNQMVLLGNHQHLHRVPRSCH
jgi:DNA phosphorothioation-dependent restriction protein DptF